MENTRLSALYAKEEGILAQYLDFLGKKNLILPSTAYNYYMTMRSLAKFLKHRRGNMECAPDEVEMSYVSAEEMSSITKDEWWDYLDYFQFRVAEKKGSLAVRISVIRGFYAWLTDAGLVSDEVSHIFRVKRPRTTRQEFVTVTEHLEETLCRNFDGENEIRNTCMVRMLLRCGLGLQELCNLDIEDIELKAVIVRGTSPRVVPLDDVTVAAIDNYVAVRNPPIDGSNAFFVSAAKGRMRRGAVQKFLRKAVAMSGPPLADVSVRDLQLTAKERMVKANGLDAAASLINIHSMHYYKRVFGKLGV